MPAATPSWVLPALTVAAAGVLLAGTATAVVQRDDDGDRETAGTTPSPRAAPRSPTPAPTAAPVEDLEARVAAAPLGFGRVDDAESGLGTLTAEQFVDRAGLTGAAREQGLASFRDLGYVEARGHAWSQDPVSIEFVVIRFGSPAQAVSALAATTSPTERFTSATVPGAVSTRTEAEGSTLLLGKLTRGPFLYQVSYVALGAPADVEEFDRVLLRQRERAVLADPG